MNTQKDHFCIALHYSGVELGGGGSSGRNSIPIPPAKCDGNQKDRFGLQKEKNKSGKLPSGKKVYGEINICVNSKMNCSIK